MKLDTCCHRRLGGERGYLTIDNIKDIYSTSKHPAVVAGKMTREEALQDFLNSFEGTEGNRDGKVTLDEWMRHYEEISCSIDSDDYFGTLISTTWNHLKQKMPDGSKVNGCSKAATHRLATSEDAYAVLFRRHRPSNSPHGLMSTC